MRTLILLLIALVGSPSLCDVDRGVSTVAENRKNKIWDGSGKDAQRRGKADENPWLTAPFEECRTEAKRIDAIRTRWQYDFLNFYNEALARPVRNRKTGQMEWQSLGQIHLWMLDFLNIERADTVKQHSPLHLYLPARDANGDFPETWLYIRTLDYPIHVEMEEGSDNRISRMFHEKFWQGIIIRLCGDGFTKCLLAPRGHLKSTIAGTYQTLWNMIRAPEERHVIRSVNSDLAKDFLDVIKHQFEQNNTFADIFGHLKPLKREGAWNTEMIQLMCANRRGAQKTVVSCGMESEKTGTHGDDYVNDDIAGESNTLTAALRAKARGCIEKQQSQCDPGANLIDIGTRWEEDDPHVMFVGKPGASTHSGTLAEYTSFMVYTVLDGDERVPVSLDISPLGYGKPIWSEAWTISTVKRKRAGHPDDRFWCGQYFNQFAGTTNRVFKKEWIRRLPETLTDSEGQVFRTADVSMLELAALLQLDIFIGADTASGLPNAMERAKRDDTAVFVLGQTKDKKRFFFLDGLREKLPADAIATGILDLSDKWYENTKRYGGNFRVGFEDTKWKKTLQPLIETEQRKRGSSFGVELLSHGNEPKITRIRILAPAYRDGLILWPHTLVVNAVAVQQSDGTIQQKPPYDLCELLEREYTAYNPYATEDNLLDGHAHAFHIAMPSDWKQEPVKETPVKQIGTYNRADVKQEGTPDFGGYALDEMERP